MAFSRLLLPSITSASVVYIYHHVNLNIHSPLFSSRFFVRKKCFFFVIIFCPLIWSLLKDLLENEKHWAISFRFLYGDWGSHGNGELCSEALLTITIENTSKLLVRKYLDRDNYSRFSLPQNVLIDSTFVFVVTCVKRKWEKENI